MFHHSCLFDSSVKQLYLRIFHTKIFFTHSPIFCLAVEAFFRPTRYIPMDIIVNSNETLDLKYGGMKVVFSRMIDVHNYGVVNNALCFKNLEKPVNILNNPFLCRSECVLSLWLKHFCEHGEEKKLFSTNNFILQCSSIVINENSTNAVVDILSERCKYSFEVFGGFWYFLAVTFRKFEKWDIYINGNKTEYLEECEYITLPDTPFEIQNSLELCIDEIMFEEQLRTEEDIKDLYNFYMYGKYD